MSSREHSIEAEGLGKRFRLGQDFSKFRYESLRDAVTAKVRRVQPPATRDFWALRNVSFSVSEGEVIGVIGRNGAGKTTLLRILSRIVEPTEGRARIVGRPGAL